MMTVAKKKPTKPSAFALRLRTIREGKEKTQKAAAKAAKVGIQTYMRWERGETEPAFKELCKLAAFFDVDLNAFQAEDE